MGAVYFYHLTESSLESTLPGLLDRARGQGWRVLVRGTDPDQLAQLDALLWQGPPESFRAHGMAGGPSDADQPILLGTQVGMEGFDCVMCIAGADLTAAEVATSKRACVLFDGHDESALSAARTQWKTLTGQGVAAQYWAQEDGRWTNKAESGGSDARA
ncbi:DNA polymerase III subunit chi [Salipiger sp. IMCC34102]|uniref:DNA polymerase III subunit chi n=1 Tax=Salipiger sp. IMCC34102 TaxID=2510647 RepID=UPI00101C5077|nr:DNA polymerase III subunit chi [Salipiger sp. IMCC34102]RYH03209.1 DNA polymerase III subunit chi [Salipiger sp. IMCC34102]